MGGNSIKAAKLPSRPGSSVAITAPSKITSTVAPGTARPATCVSPSASAKNSDSVGAAKGAGAAFVAWDGACGAGAALA
jgi:hypothetical protein